MSVAHSGGGGSQRREYAKAMEEYTPQKQENEERMEAASPSMSVAHSGDDRACS